MRSRPSTKLSTPAVLGLAAAAIVLIVGAVYFLRGDAVLQEFASLQQTPAPALSLSAEDRRAEGAADLAWNEREYSPGRMAVLLERRYAASIDQPRAQVGLLEELAETLRRRYPDDWVRQMQQILRTAFPDQATELFALAETLYRYSDAMSQRRDLLGRMTRSERRSLLWRIRTEYFGERAVQIWAVERQLERVERALDQLAGQPSLSPDERLRRYRERIVELVGDPASPELAHHRLGFSQAFLDTIQKELRAMSSTDRSRLMQQVRARLGMDPAALARWATLDRQRDQRWDRGEIYKGRRAEIIASYDGAERAARLDGLRRELFGAEAAILAREEAAGFFRYESNRPRRFGRE